MATSKDYSSPVMTAWIHDLARAEAHPDAERVLGLGSALDPHQLVEESTIQFLQELRERFNEYARVFNSYSEAGARFSETKIYSVAQTPADFMIFRNQVKLVIANSAHGVIQIAFAQHNRSIASMAANFDGANPQSVQGPQPQELLAQVGPFRDVKWTFQGEQVKPEQIAKFYFAEFARSTRSAKTTPTKNQLLIEQIKALLQEKGVDF